MHDMHRQGQQKPPTHSVFGDLADLRQMHVLGSRKGTDGDAVPYEVAPNWAASQLQSRVRWMEISGRLRACNSDQSHTVKKIKATVESHLEVPSLLDVTCAHVKVGETVPNPLCGMHGCAVSENKYGDDDVRRVPRKTHEETSRGGSDGPSLSRKRALPCLACGKGTPLTTSP